MRPKCPPIHTSILPINTKDKSPEIQINDSPVKVMAFKGMQFWTITWKYDNQVSKWKENHNKQLK